MKYDPTYDRTRSREHIVHYTMAGLAPHPEEAVAAVQAMVDALHQSDPCPATEDMIWNMKFRGLETALKVMESMEGRTSESPDRGEGQKRILSIAWGVPVEKLGEVQKAVDVVGRAMAAGQAIATHGVHDGYGGKIDLEYHSGLKSGEDLQAAEDLLIALGAVTYEGRKTREQLAQEKLDGEARERGRLTVIQERPKLAEEIAKYDVKLTQHMHTLLPAYEVLAERSLREELGAKTGESWRDWFVRCIGSKPNDDVGSLMLREKWQRKSLEAASKDHRSFADVIRYEGRALAIRESQECKLLDEAIKITDGFVKELQILEDRQRFETIKSEYAEVVQRTAELVGGTRESPSGEKISAVIEVKATPELQTKLRGQVALLQATRAILQEIVASPATSDKKEREARSKVGSALQSQDLSLAGLERLNGLAESMAVNTTVSGLVGEMNRAMDSLKKVLTKHGSALMKDFTPKGVETLDGLLDQIAGAIASSESLEGDEKGSDQVRRKIMQVDQLSKIVKMTLRGEEVNFEEIFYDLVEPL